MSLCSLISEEGGEFHAKHDLNKILIHQGPLRL